MKTLIVEDDFACRKLLEMILSEYGECVIVNNGKQAVHAFEKALQDGDPFELVCLDILMPKLDGQKSLKEFRRLEQRQGVEEIHGAKVIMTTSVDDRQEILTAFEEGCAAYLVKPISQKRLLEEIVRMGLCESECSAASDKMSDDF